MKLQSIWQQRAHITLTAVALHCGTFRVRARFPRMDRLTDLGLPASALLSASAARGRTNAHYGKQRVRRLPPSLSASSSAAAAWNEWVTNQPRFGHRLVDCQWYTKTTPEAHNIRYENGDQ